MTDSKELFGESMPEEGTIIEGLNSNEKLLKAMLDMPDSMNRKMVELRRDKKFSMFWENTSMEKSFVLKYVKKRENSLIEYCEEEDIDLPEWLLRAECQDILLKSVYEKFEDEGLL